MDMQINASSHLASIKPYSSTRPKSGQSSDNPPEKNHQSSKSEELSSKLNEQRYLQQLKAIDREVRAHELAHLAVGGRYVTSGAQFEYERGPDGRNYAVSGEVSIDTSEIPGDPQATLTKALVVLRAALAPANPSAQDRRVAAQATSIIQQARADIIQLSNKNIESRVGQQLDAFA
jgi:hypothetical protein